MTFPLAFSYLREAAVRYARAAVIADKEGNYEVAIDNYRKAIEMFSKIIRLYPDSPLASTYREFILKYKKRIKELEELKTQKINYGGTPGGNGDSFWKDIILDEKPNIKFSDIADLEDAKKAIREAIVYPYERPDLFPLGWPRGILLFGPPGCGKTMLAAAVANEIDSVFIQVDAATIMSKWLGEAEKNVARIFKFARKKSSEGKPVIIFIDEVDALLGVFPSTEVGGEVRVRNQFLKEMDGLQDKSNKHYIYVIGATNKPWKLDEAFIRRFNKRIYIPLPNRESRIELFKLYLKSLPKEGIDYEKLADLTKGYSGSDIRDVVNEAITARAREIFEKNGGVGEARPITMRDLIEAIKKRKPSVDPLIVKRIEAWASQYNAL